ncbi:prealbumin-like fold domain-containing protein [Jatrophihabitans sp.]|uniref:prealbumin-like fold domain-containing protein n=1 Tax=Jatrophihabitans sp. TaxID=1932789 RepID=UPI002BBA4C2F|nr:hypothetical protein [Jatrophihabitans sp.]
MLVATTASANLAGTTFEGNDGNMVVNTAGNTDWANVAGVSTGVDKPSGSTDNSFGQGTKEDNAAVTVVTGSIPPNKNDLSRFYVASSLGANNHNYLYLAWERLVNIGNANLDFEINQKTTTGFTSSTTGPVTLNRTAGDLLVTYDFGGSGTPTLGLNFWLTAAAGNTAGQCFSANALPCWGKHINLSGAVSEGAVNTVSIVDPLQAGSPTLGVGLFGEASIDLTAANVFPAGICEAFGSAFVKSRSSSSFTAEIKDFIAPIPVNISNCGRIVIHKVTENGDSSFGYTTTGLTPATFSLSNGGTRTYDPVPVGSYSVTENLTAAQVSDGWTLKNLQCTATGSGTSATPSGATVNITMGAVGLVECTYTNNRTFHPTIATLLSASTAKVGDSITDSSTLSGASSTAGGTVTYSAYAGQNTCTGTDLLNSTKTVTNAVVPNSDAFVAAAAGYYSFQAVYSGDSANAGATSVCSTEQLLVQAQPSASTAQHLIPNDSFTLSGATSTAGGTITMSLYGPADATCSGAPALTQTVNVSGNGTYSTTNTSFVASTEGTWRWQSSYSGDTFNLAATSSCGTERFTIANS